MSEKIGFVFVNGSYKPVEIRMIMKCFAGHKEEYTRGFTEEFGSVVRVFSNIWTIVVGI